MMSYPKLGVHNISQRHQRRTEPRPQATCTRHFVKFGHTCGFQDMQVNRQTYRLTDRCRPSYQLCNPFHGQRNKNSQPHKKLSVCRSTQSTGPHYRLTDRCPLCHQFLVLFIPISQIMPSVLLRGWFGGRKGIIKN